MDEIDQKIRSFFRRKIDILQNKNNQLRFHILQIQNERSDKILLRIYESEIGVGREDRIIKGYNSLYDDLFIENLIDEVYHKK